MPANLPPQYFEAEKSFRAAKTAAEKIAALEEMLAIMPKHKGTDHLRAELRARIAKLSQGMDKKSGGHRASMIIPREGAAQVVVVGLPNAGKSQLVASVTNAAPAVAEYPYTTHSATPGMMPFENIKIQLIDTPPLAPQSIEAWLPAIIKRADILLVLLDLSFDPLIQMTEVVGQLSGMKVTLNQGDAETNPVLTYRKSVLVGNKLDMPGAKGNFEILQTEYRDRLPVAGISAKKGDGIAEMKRLLFETLDIMRVYTRTPGGKPDFSDPIILPRGSTLEDAAVQVHKDFLARLKYARVWGSGKHEGVMVKRDHVLQDGDVIELHA